MLLLGAHRQLNSCKSAARRAKISCLGGNKVLRAGKIYRSASSAAYAAYIHVFYSIKQYVQKTYLASGIYHYNKLLSHYEMRSSDSIPSSL